MSAWQLLVNSDFGLMSLVVIAITLAMGAGFTAFFIKHANDKP